MVEGKTVGSAALIVAPWGSQASANFDKQLNNQIDAIRLDGKGRALVVCVGSDQNAAALSNRYWQEKFKIARFQVCAVE